MKEAEDKEDLVLEFGYVPSSPNYAVAVELAESISTYSSHGSGRQLRHRVIFTDAEANKFIQLYEIVKKWKSLQVYKGESSASRWGVESSIRCYLSRIRSDDKDAYCYVGNWIGCRRVREGHLLMLSYGVGKFISKDMFEPNKDEIRRRVERGIDEFSYGICPAFKIERIHKEIIELPPLIQLNNNPDWQPIAEPEYGSDLIRLTAIEYGLKREIPKGPVIDGDDELLGAYKIRPRTGQNIWEHKILILSHDEWVLGAQSGNIPKISELGQMGWMLLNIVRVDDQWHCIFQRIV